MQSVYYNNLGAGQKAYDAALRCFQNREESFSLTASLPAAELMIAVLNDHPEIFYVGQGFRVKIDQAQREVMPAYLYSPAETAEIRSRLEAEADGIVNSRIKDHQSDYDRVLALHDSLKCSLNYDSAAAGCHKPNDRRIAEAHSIVGALLKKRCICEGFAKAFKFLCDKIGLECWVVSGTCSSRREKGPHAWNIVKINGYYHHVDVTWDVPYSDLAAIPNYRYLNLSDEEIAGDHAWNRKNYPACPISPYNYFKVNDALIETRAQLETMLYRNFQMEEEIILFRVVPGSVLEGEINSCLTDSVQRAAKRCKHVSVPSFRYGGVAEQLIFFVRPEYAYQ